MSNELTFYDDRSASELDDSCGMKYYWNRIAGGRGLVPNEEALALRVGAEIHEDFSQVADSKDISEGALAELCRDIQARLTNPTQAELELLYRRLGWLVAFGLYIEPLLRQEYENVSTEGELILDRSPLQLAVTPDRLLRSKLRKHLVYKEWKSTITASQKWLRSWQRRIQLHTSMLAIEEERGEKVAFSQVMGLQKGDYREGKLRHPYVWAYYNASTGKWGHDYQACRGQAWELQPVWNFAPGVVEWVKILGPDEAMAQFPHTEPIFLDREMVEKWAQRRIARHLQIKAWREGNTTPERHIIFPQCTQNCIPAFGDPCPYNPLCWNATWYEHPERHPDFKVREPHHLIEKLGMVDYEG